MGGYSSDHAVAIKPNGYHKAEIPRGEYGEISKIHEEVMELVDAGQQGNKIMILVELSDIIGAINGYLSTHFQDHVLLDDLIKMAQATQRAFDSGERK